MIIDNFFCYLWLFEIASLFAYLPSSSGISGHLVILPNAYLDLSALCRFFDACRGFPKFRLEVCPKAFRSLQSLLSKFVLCNVFPVSLKIVPLCVLHHEPHSLESSREVKHLPHQLEVHRLSKFVLWSASRSTHRAGRIDPPTGARWSASDMVLPVEPANLIESPR